MLQRRLLFVSILIILKLVIANEEHESHNFDSNYYDDVDYGNYSDYGSYDYQCHYHHDLNEAHACHHDKFSLQKPLPDIYGKNVKQCCGFHGYTFINNCEVSTIVCTNMNLKSQGVAVQFLASLW